MVFDDKWWLRFSDCVRGQDIDEGMKPIIGLAFRMRVFVLLMSAFELVLLAERHEEFDEHRLLCRDWNLFDDDFVCVTGVAVPCLSLGVGVIVCLGFAVSHVEACVVGDAVAFDADLLAVIL